MKERENMNNISFTANIEGLKSSTLTTAFINKTQKYTNLTMVCKQNPKCEFSFSDFSLIKEGKEIAHTKLNFIESYKDAEEKLISIFNNLRAKAALDFISKNKLKDNKYDILIHKKV